MALPVYKGRTFSSGGDLTWTPNATSNLGLLLYGEEQTTAGLSTVTWDGSAMTLLVNATNSNCRVQMWGILNPTVGSSIIVDTGIDAATRDYDFCFAMVAKSVDTTVPLASYTTYSATGNCNAGVDDIDETITLTAYQLFIDGLTFNNITTSSSATGDNIAIVENTYRGISQIKGTDTSVKWDLNHASDQYAWVGVKIPGVDPSGGVTFIPRVISMGFELRNGIVQKKKEIFRIPQRILTPFPMGA